MGNGIHGWPWDGFAYCRAVQPLPCWPRRVFDDLYLHSTCCVRQILSHLLIRGSHFITTLLSIHSIPLGEPQTVSQKCLLTLKFANWNSFVKTLVTCYCVWGMCALTPLAPEHGVCLQVDEQAADTWSSLPCSTNPDWKSYPHRPIFLSFTFLFAHCFYRSDEVLCPWKWYSAYIWLQTCKEELTPSASWDFIPLEVDILSQPSGFITCFLSTSLALTICSPECIHPNIRVFGRKFVFCLFKIFFYTIILYRGSWNATIKSVAIYTRGAKKIWLVFSFSYWHMLSITILI